jgi:quinol monooxygenase YgiN
MDKANPSVVVASYAAFVKVLQLHVPRVRKKHGCIAYTFAVDVAGPNVLRMSEAWRDRQSLESHLADGEFRGVRKELVGVEFIERSVQRYDVSSITGI